MTDMFPENLARIRNRVRMVGSEEWYYKDVAALITALEESRNNEALIDAEHTEMGYQLEAAKAAHQSAENDVQTLHELNQSLAEWAEGLKEQLNEARAEIARLRGSRS